MQTHYAIRKQPLQLPQQPKSRQYATFNGRYNVISLLGEGLTSEVFLCEEIKTQEKVAIKIMKESFAPDLDQNSVFFSEVTILKCLEHEGIVNLKGSGTDGIFIHPNGDVKEGICYIVTEYIQHNLFDFCKTMGGMGEEAGKFFLHQIINVAEYIHQKGIAHRDIKLENILLDS